MYAHPEYLVETGWLEDHLEDASLRVFDVTGMLTSELVNLAEARSYARGHIPGAAFLNVAGRDQALARPGAPIPWTWPSAEEAAATLGALGVDNRSQVVLYAASPRPGVDKGVMWATRAWWVMHALGVRCAVLNGGWEKWVAEGRPVSTTPSRYPPTTFAASPAAPAAIVTKDEVAAALSDPRAVVVDALSPESYAGTAKVAYGARRGHIRGAVNVPMDELLAQDGTFLDPDRLEAALRAAGVLDAERVMTYCGAGIAATVDAFAAELLGHPHVAVYDASLREWASDPELPMAPDHGNERSREPRR